MALTFIASAVGASDSSGTTLDTSSTLNVQAGDVLIAMVAWMNANETASLAQTDGTTNRFQMLSDYTNYYSIYGKCGYVVSAAASSTATFRFTLTGAATNRTVTVLQFRPDANCTVHLYLEGAVGEGTGTSLSSASARLIGTDVIDVAFSMVANAATFSNLQINGASPDGTVTNGTRVRAWYEHFSANDSAVAATGTIASSDEWFVTMVALRSVPINTTVDSIQMYTTLWGTDGVERTDLPNTGGLLVTGWVKSPPMTGSYPKQRGNLYVADLVSSNMGIICLTCNGTVSAAGEGASIFNANTMCGAVDPAGPLGDYTLYYENDYTVSERDFLGWNFYALQVVMTSTAMVLRQWLKPGRGQGLRLLEETHTFTDMRAQLVAGGWTQAAADAWTPVQPTTIRIGNLNGGDTSADCMYDATNYKIYIRNDTPSLEEIDAISIKGEADTSAWADWELNWSGGSANLADRSGNSRNLSILSGGTLHDGQTYQRYDAATFVFNRRQRNLLRR